MGDQWFRIEVGLAEALASSLDDEAFLMKIREITGAHGKKLSHEYEQGLLLAHHLLLSKLDHNAKSDAQGRDLAHGADEAKGKIGGGFDQMMQPFMQAGQQGMQAMGQLPQQAMQGLQGLGQGGPLKDMFNPKSIGDTIKGLTGDFSKLGGNDAAGHDSSLHEGNGSHSGHSGNDSHHHGHHRHAHTPSDSSHDGSLKNAPELLGQHSRDEHIELHNPSITINPDPTNPGAISTQAAGGVDASRIEDDRTAKDTVHVIDDFRW